MNSSVDGQIIQVSFSRLKFGVVGSQLNEIADTLYFSRGNLLGKALRIDVRGRRRGRYTTPADNPFTQMSGTAIFPNRPEIYAYGLRNPWRCSKDKGDIVTGKNIIKNYII